MRRRLSVYTLLTIAGIAAGFFTFEKLRILGGLGFLASTGVAAALFFPEEERSKCIASLLLGFILMGFCYANYESFEMPADRISGRVIRVTDKGEYTRLIVKENTSGRRIELELDTEDDNANYVVVLTGAVIEADGKEKELRPSDNPGCFDYRLYMRSMGISGSFKANSIVVRSEGSELIWKLRRALISEREGFLDKFDQESAGVLRGVIFGDKSEMDEEVIKEFDMNSSGHILAVSGLHIGFLYALLKLLSSDKKTWPASLGIILILIIYGEMTLWSASTVRAVIVLGTGLAAVNFRRNFDLLSSLSAAALVILISNPYMLFNSGFQLSFAAMTSIAFLAKRISAYTGNLLGVTFAVQIGTVPLIALTFKRVNLMAFAINIPIIMLSSVLVPLCILSLMIYMMTGLLPGFIIRIIAYSAEALITSNHVLGMGGFFSNPVGGITPSALITVYGILALLSCEWFRIALIRRDYSRIRKLLLLALIPSLMSAASLYDRLSDDEIVFVAVGQGDSVHINSGSTDLLIDGGGSDFTNVGERVLMPYLLSRGAKDIDMAFVTHLHKDHYQGIAELAAEYPLKVLTVPSDYEKSHGGSDVKAAKVRYLRAESEIRINDEVSIRTLWPVRAHQRDISADDPNEHNMVYMIDYRGIRIMVTGDLLEEDEEKMTRHYRGTDELKCDILKIAHHGSKSSSSEAFLDAASPEIAVIQVGRGNIYGHPHTQTLERLDERGIEIYRTDTDGAVGIDIDRKGRYKVDTFRN